jgi:hypothetical protein
MAIAKNNNTSNLINNTLELCKKAMVLISESEELIKENQYRLNVNGVYYEESPTDEIKQLQKDYIILYNKIIKDEINRLSKVKCDSVSQYEEYYSVIDSLRQNMLVPNGTSSNYYMSIDLNRYIHNRSITNIVDDLRILRDKTSDDLANARIEKSNELKIEAFAILSGLTKKQIKLKLEASDKIIQNESVKNALYKIKDIIDKNLK